MAQLQQIKNEMVKTTKVENSDGDKLSSDNVTSFNLDVSDNPYILAPPPIESPQKLPKYHLYLSNMILENSDDII